MSITVSLEDLSIRWKIYVPKKPPWVNSSPFHLGGTEFYLNCTVSRTNMVFLNLCPVNGVWSPGRFETSVDVEAGSTGEMLEPLCSQCALDSFDAIGAVDDVDDLVPCGNRPFIWKKHTSIIEREYRKFRWKRLLTFEITFSEWPVSQHQQGHSNLLQNLSPTPEPQVYPSTSSSSEVKTPSTSSSSKKDPLSLLLSSTKPQNPATSSSTETQNALTSSTESPSTSSLTEPQKPCSTRDASVQVSSCSNPSPCLESLLEDLAKMLDEEDSNPDVELHCDDHITKAHKSVLTVRSPVLASMLTCDMVEGRTGVVKIQDMDIDTFQRFLRYLYTGTLDELSFDKAMPLYEAGDMYEVKCLARRCSEFLIENLTVDNACDVLIMADAHSDANFLDAAMDFSLLNKVPLSNKDWRAFSDSHPKLANQLLTRMCEVLSK